MPWSHIYTEPLQKRYSFSCQLLTVKIVVVLEYSHVSVGLAIFDNFQNAILYPLIITLYTLIFHTDQNVSVQSNMDD